MPINNQARFRAAGCSGVVLWYSDSPDKGGMPIHIGNELTYKVSTTSAIYSICTQKGLESCKNSITTSVKAIDNSTNSNKSAVTAAAVSTNTDYEGLLSNLKNIIPPSPNASSLGKYGDIPVSLYRGIPNIDIPITSVDLKGLKVPISLSYHAGGNKVGEIASWVGLGWSLNAGGVITRSVRGMHDDSSPDGYLRLRQRYTNAVLNNPSSFSEIDVVNVAKSTADAEQDSYSLNLLGRSYQLIFKPDNTITTIPYSDLKITNNILSTYTTSQSWTVTTEDGIVYTFGGGNNSTEINSNPRFDPTTYVSSWYLKSIKLPTGQQVNFTYTLTSIKQDSYFSQTDYIEEPISVPAGTGYSHGSLSSKAEIQTVGMPTLSTIESDLVRVDLVTTSNRQDLEGGTTLSQINVFSKVNSTYVEKYSFEYTYSNAVSGNTYNPSGTTYFNYRLRLLNFKKLSLTGGTPQTWSFYYNATNLPS